MRPLWIQLVNFGPYAKETIPLQGISAATIVGPTGSGKSLGIPEAITWCFFMEGRASDPDGFIRAGQTDAAVTVGFLVNGETYRAARTRSIRTKRGKTEFAIHKQVGDEWEPVDRSIEDLIQVDYTTLTASNFIMQKDPFDLCEARPKDRIALISKLLGHERFADYVKLANRKANVAEGQVKALLEAQAGVLEQANRHDAAVASLDEHEKGLAVLGGQLAEAESAKTELVKKIATLEAQIAAIPEQADAFAAQTQQRALVETKGRLEKQLREMTLLAEQEPALIHKQGELSGLVGKHDAMRNERQTRQQEIEQKEQDVSQAQASIDAINKQLADIQQQRADLTTKSVVAMNTINACDQWVKSYQKDTETIKADIAKAETQIGLLATVPCGEDLQRKCGFTKAAIAVKDNDLPALRATLAARETSAETIAGLSPHNKAQAGVTLEELKAKERELAAEGMRLSDSGDAVKLEAKAEDLRMRRKALKRCEDGASDLEQICANIRTQLADLPKVQHAKETIPTIQADLDRNIEALDRVGMELKRLTEQASKKVTLQADLSQATSKLESQEAFLAGLKGLKADRDKKILETQMTLSETKGAKDKLVTFDAEHEALKAEIEAYSQLAECYKRVPVLMMENVIPIIEEEANKALLKLSLKGMQLRFESQKALKTVDKVVDEMNIYVTDRDGERVYETYSGGEHGLGNFATRLGIAKLTSTRSGVKLETIIVDETFASMGEEVSQRVREYLESLTEQYPLVLIITHDVTLKGSLPAQITMIPSEQGTKVEVTV